MKQADREILETLNRQDQPRYASWLISRNKRRYGLFSAQDLAEDFLAPLVRAGLIAFAPWDGRMQWDTASERGCHRGIGSVGVAC